MSKVAVTGPGLCCGGATTFVEAASPLCVWASLRVLNQEFLPQISLMGGILGYIKVPCVVLHGSSVHLCSLHLTFYTNKKVSILILKFIIFIHKHFSLCIAP